MVVAPTQDVRALSAQTVLEVCGLHPEPELRGHSIWEAGDWPSPSLPVGHGPSPSLPGWRTDWSPALQAPCQPVACLAGLHGAVLPCPSNNLTLNSENRGDLGIRTWSPGSLHGNVENCADVSGKASKESFRNAPGNGQFPCVALFLPCEVLPLTSQLL